MVDDEVSTQVWEGAPVRHWQALWGLPSLHIYRRVTSTNDIAHRLAQAGAPSGSVVIADEQIAGRGKGGKRWYAPAGKALLLSLVLRPQGAAGEGASLTVVTLLLALAAACAVGRLARIDAGIKWPNDVVLHRKAKLCGVLCEEEIGAGSSAYVVAGAGINVTQEPDDFPPEVRSRATSLYLATGRTIPRAELAGALLNEVSRLADRMSGPLNRSTLAELAERDVLRSRKIIVNGARRGTALGIVQDGALVVRLDGEAHASVHRGSVRLI